jgi:hypothetical protein
MKMKEKICLAGLLLGRIMGASLPTQIKACFSAMETAVHLQPKSWEGYAYDVLGFSGSTVSPFSEVW